MTVTISLRAAAILFGQGENFSRGMDVDAHKAAIGAMLSPALDNTGLI